ncbi:hypothetical protein Dda_4374 [Drechslerella dactyloides]|uniref:Peptidase A1 domain-containing protein n=1 Tax=Drechslerella dactyloides TaxID=74499 RepID=A0AAD6IX69_DREDA|nr:hypothetical protein Dda_4374 [Drechslerella dactyloides]
MISKPTAISAVLLACYTSQAFASLPLNLRSAESPPLIPFKYAHSANAKRSPDVDAPWGRVQGAHRSAGHLKRREIDAAQNKIVEAPNAPMQLSGKTQSGKIPVFYRHTDQAETKFTWVASVNITGKVYELTVDNTVSNTWLYAPSDPYKCLFESKVTGKDFCYSFPFEDAPEPAMIIDRTWPFSVNFTGPGGVAVSGVRALLNNVTDPLGRPDGARWPSVIGLVDNTYDSYGSGSPPDIRFYAGTLGLGKADKGVILQGTNTTERIEKYPQTPFNNYTSLTYFTTNFNMALDNGQMSIGLGHMDKGDYTGDMKTIPTSPGSDDWSFDANGNWTVKIWENITTNAGVQEIVRVVPFPTMNMSTSQNVILDLTSRITYLDFDTAEAIYKAFDGSCTRTPTPMGFSHPKSTDPIYPYCTLPILQTWNSTDRKIRWKLKTPATFSLPWGPDGEIMILDQESMLDTLEGFPCANNDVPQCEQNVFGSIQPNIFTKHSNSLDAPMTNAGFWVYGDVVFKNAYLKWDTANGGSVSMAKYASPPGQGNVDMNNPKPNAAKPPAKPKAKVNRLPEKPKSKLSLLPGRYGFKSARE